MPKSQLSWVSIPASSDTMESEELKMKQCWIKYIHTCIHTLSIRKLAADNGSSDQGCPKKESPDLVRRSIKLEDDGEDEDEEDDDDRLDVVGIGDNSRRESPGISRLSVGDSDLHLYCARKPNRCFQNLRNLAFWRAERFLWIVFALGGSTSSLQV